MTGLYYFDTEFIEQRGYLEPISIGMVCEDGREFYAVSNEFHVDRADPWVVANVIAKLPPLSQRTSLATIAVDLRAFVVDDAPSFVAYFASYDWVVLCWLLGGRMVDVPKGWPMFPMDLKQAMVERGVTRRMLPAQPAGTEHNALDDARWVRDAHAVVYKYAPIFAHAP